MAAAPGVEEVDPFDLPAWLGERSVTFMVLSSVGQVHQVEGLLSGPQREDRLSCDVLACDLAYPVPVLSEVARHDAHQAWVLGQVLVARYQERLTLVVPGAAVTADLVLDAVRRLAKAVGAPADRFTVALRL